MLANELLADNKPHQFQKLCWQCISWWWSWIYSGVWSCPQYCQFLLQEIHCVLSQACLHSGQNEQILMCRYNNRNIKFQLCYSIKLLPILLFPQMIPLHSCACSHNVALQALSTQRLCWSHWIYILWVNDLYGNDNG